MLQTDINACVSAKEIGGVSANNGRRLGEESTAVLLIFSMLESK